MSTPVGEEGSWAQAMPDAEGALEIALPCDRAGFVRRQCRWCLRHFKLRPGAQDGIAVLRWLSRSLPQLELQGSEAPEHLRCPYCSQAGTTEDWLTADHRGRIERLAQRLRGVLTFTSLNQVTTGLGHTARPTFLPVPPEPLPGCLGREPNDLLPVALICCDLEVKIHADWDGGLHCPQCGTHHARSGSRRQVKLTFVPE
jgi:hypothetical protein